MIIYLDSHHQDFMRKKVIQMKWMKILRILSLVYELNIVWRSEVIFTFYFNNKLLWWIDSESVKDEKFSARIMTDLNTICIRNILKLDSLQVCIIDSHQEKYVKRNQWWKEENYPWTIMCVQNREYLWDTHYWCHWVWHIKWRPNHLHNLRFLLKDYC